MPENNKQTNKLHKVFKYIMCILIGICIIVSSESTIIPLDISVYETLVLGSLLTLYGILGLVIIENVQK